MLTKLAPSGNSELADYKIVDVASVAKCWRQKRFRGDLYSQSTFHLVYYLHMPIGTVWIYRLLFVCLFVFLCVCTVTDFAGEHKASGVKFRTVVLRRPVTCRSGFSVGLAPCPIATSLSLTIGISAASIGLPGLSALPETRFPIAGFVCPVDQWIRDERNMKTLRPFSVFSVSKKNDYPV